MGRQMKNNYLQFIFFLLLRLFLAFNASSLPLGLTEAILVGLALQRPLSTEIVL